jgi:lipoate-protein ligase B
MDYGRAYLLQKELLRKRQNNTAGDHMIIVEHHPVFTIGRSGRRSNILVEEDVLNGNSITVFEIDRGGDVTYHGPGQLVAYPIIALRDYGMNIHGYLRNLEECIIRSIEEFGVPGCRIKGLTGVWAEGKKVASIGIGISKWVSYHGIALNVNNDLKYFRMINPCGITGCEVTSLSAYTGREVDITRVKERFLVKFEEVFGAVVNGYSGNHTIPCVA